MTLLIDHRLARDKRGHKYNTVKLDGRQIMLPSTDFLILCVLACRYLQGKPLVHHDDLVGDLTLRYVHRTRRNLKKAGIPIDIASCYPYFMYHYHLIANEIDLTISNALLLSEDFRVREEVKKYLYATQGVASVA